MEIRREQVSPSASSSVEPTISTDDLVRETLLSSSSLGPTSLTDDLVREILLNLPIKSLVQSKLVCKAWMSIICNPRFFPNPTPARGILFGSMPYRIPNIPLYPNIDLVSLASPPIGNYEILHSSNGLILYTLYGISYRKTINVCNPTTSCTVPLPQDLTASDLFLDGAFIVFDPYKSQHYKVVTVSNLLDNSATGEGSGRDIRIYSSEANTWSDGGEMTVSTTKYFRFHQGVYWNGSIHWLAWNISDGGLRFHVDSLVIVEMPAPPSILTYAKGHHYFGESCDHLHFAECTLPQFNIYEMARDYSEWFVKYQVDLSNLISEYPEVKRPDGRYIAYILSLVRVMNDETDSSFLVLRTPKKAIKCNLVDGSLEELQDFIEGVPKDYRQEKYGRCLTCIDPSAVDYFPCLTNV